MSRVEKWLMNYSESTQNRYGAALRAFCDRYKVTPEETRSWHVDLAEDRMVDWKNERKEILAGKTVRLDFTAVKQWFLFNRIRVAVLCKNVPATRTVLDYIPLRENIQRLLDSARLSHKVAIGLMAFSGLRPIDVVQLEFQNIKASYWKNDEVLTVVKQHQKTREWYVGFVGTQGTRYIRGYLKSREERGEKMTDRSPVVLRWNKGPLKSTSLRSTVQRLINGSVGRYPTGESFRRFRPYCLRKYFRRAVNKIGFAEAEYLMGHREGLEGLAASYGGLRDLDQQAIDSLKKKYISILPELETEITDVTLRAQLQDKETEKKELVDDLSSIREELDEIKDFIRKRREMDL